jgi:hypothetical protein
MVRLVEAQKDIETAVHKAEKIGRLRFATEQAAVEFLLVRGTPIAGIALDLGVGLEDIHAVEHMVESNKAKQRYRDACLSRALTDEYPGEAAEYLFVRGFTRKELEALGLAKDDTELSTVKRARYWRRLIAQVLV